MPGDVHFGRHHRAVQSFVEHQIGVLGYILPGREGAGLLVVGRRLLFVVQVLADPAAAGVAVVAEQRLEVPEQVVLGAEVAEVLVARAVRLGQLQLHLIAVVAMEAESPSMTAALTPSRRKIVRMCA